MHNEDRGLNVEYAIQSCWLECRRQIDVLGQDGSFGSQAVDTKYEVRMSSPREGLQKTLPDRAALDFRLIYVVLLVRVANPDLETHWPAAPFCPSSKA